MPRPAQPDCKPSDIPYVFAGADSVILSRLTTKVLLARFLCYFCTTRPKLKQLNV